MPEAWAEPRKKQLITSFVCAAVAAFVAVTATAPSVAGAEDSLAPATLPAEPPWNEVTSRGPFTLFNRLKPGETMREFLVKGTVESAPTELVGILKDVPRFPLWMVGCDKATLLEAEDPAKPGDTSRIYLYLGAPFPFRDRDLEIFVTHFQNEETGEWEFVSRALPDAEARTKPTSDAIRVVKSTGTWKFKRATDPLRTEISYQWHSDPGGSLPAWIANKVTEKAPLETLENLYARALCLRSPPSSNPRCAIQ